MSIHKLKYYNQLAKKLLLPKTIHVVHCLWKAIGHSQFSVQSLATGTGENILP